MSNIRLITITEEALNTLFDEKLNPIYEKINGAKKYQNIEEAAIYTGFSKDNLRKAVKGGLLARINLDGGGKDIFDVKDLDKYMTTLRKVEK